MFGNKNIFKKAFENQVEGCDVEQVQIRPQSLELLRFCFNITSIDILNLILHDFLDIENFCRYVVSFIKTNMIIIPLAPMGVVAHHLRMLDDMYHDVIEKLLDIIHNDT